MARINKERNPFGTAEILIKRVSEPAGENGSIAAAQSIENYLHVTDALGGMR